MKEKTFARLNCYAFCNRSARSAHLLRINKGLKESDRKRKGYGL